ncbi:hypothetical protein XENOCAPTIV_012708 [Xenoophorus captivus]|uniref:Uncharacterized protein n=1 Tax=Xenoophorus captivus TaxID=1517983 RepID=A0ABV0S6U3_9TELE
MVPVETSTFRVLNAAERCSTERYMYFNNQRLPWLRTDIRQQQSDSRDHSLHFPQQQSRAAGVKRCLVDVLGFSLRVLMNKAELRLREKQLRYMWEIFPIGAVAEPNKNIFLLFDMSEPDV